VKVSKYNLTISFIYLLLSVLIAHKLFAFPSSLNTIKVFETDGIFTQVQIQSFIDGAIFGSTNHLGFPYGYSHWLSPQFSPLEAFLVFGLGNITSITNFGLITIIGIIAIFFNALSMHFLGSVLTKNRLSSFTFGVLGLTTHFAFNSLLHPHVMKIFTIPIILAILIKLINGVVLNSRLVLLGVLAILGSSLFWINVLMAIFIVLVVIQLIDFALLRSLPKFLICYLKTGIFVFFGFVFNTVLYLYSHDLMGDRDRLAWQSDIFSGKFTDVLVGSPFLNSNIQILKNVVPGSSPEAWSIMLGLPLVLAFLATIYFSISFKKPNQDNDVNKALKQISIVSVLFFVLGGLSNLQASFFVLIGSATPMRTWSRLSIVVAIIGLCLIYLSFKGGPKKTALSIFSTVLIIFAFIEVLASPKGFVEEGTWTGHELFNATNFINNELKPCPVLQLPVDTYLLPQSALDRGYRYYWSGLIPYIVFPKFNWTAATYTNSPGWQELEKLPSTINDQTLTEISSTYCAVLFDKDFSQYQIDRSAGLKGTIGLWPGLRIETSTKPQFEDKRFSVYILK